jgi:hypothetical protein
VLCGAALLRNNTNNADRGDGERKTREDQISLPIGRELPGDQQDKNREKENFAEERDQRRR